MLDTFCSRKRVKEVAFLISTNIRTRYLIWDNVYRKWGVFCNQPFFLYGRAFRYNRFCRISLAREGGSGRGGAGQGMTELSGVGLGGTISAKTHHRKIHGSICLDPFATASPLVGKDVLLILGS